MMYVIDGREEEKTHQEYIMKLPYSGLVEGMCNIGVLVAICYGSCSIAMAFANKYLLTMFLYDYEFFIMAAQMLFTVITLEVLRIMGKVNLPRYNIQRGYM